MGLVANFTMIWTRVFIYVERGMGRKAQVYRPNWVALCPGSLLTSMANLFAMPTSAETFVRDRVYPCGLGQPLVRSWKPLFPRSLGLDHPRFLRGKAARTMANIFEMTNCGFYFGSRVYNKR